MNMQEYLTRAFKTDELGFESVTWTLAEMIETNYDDADFCEWAHNAKIGDRFAGVISVIRVA